MSAIFIHKGVTTSEFFKLCPIVMSNTFSTRANIFQRGACDPFFTGLMASFADAIL